MVAQLFEDLKFWDSNTCLLSGGARSIKVSVDGSSSVSLIKITQASNPSNSCTTILRPAKSLKSGSYTLSSLKKFTLQMEAKISMRKRQFIKAMRSILSM